jgi:hypothetical protein
MHGISRAKTIIVDNAPRLLQVEEICRALLPDTTVVIPMSEDPAFDFLKSKLYCHGVIGASAPHSPHQIWWGGMMAAKPVRGRRDLLQSHLVSCIRRDTPEERSAALFAKALDALNISYCIERADVSLDDTPELRSRLLLNAWASTEKPLIWLDPNCTGEPMSISVDLKGVDFAAMLTPSATFSMNFLYFGRSQAAFEFLKCWNDLCRQFPSLPASHLLDATWALICAQRTLRTAWIPPLGSRELLRRANCYATPINDSSQPQTPLSYPSQRQARRAGRTGAPEPHCVLKGMAGGRGALSLIVLAESAAAHQTAETVNSAVDAFCNDDGGFSVFGIVICKTEREAVEAAQKINDGAYLYVLAGLTLERDVFRVLSQQPDSPHPVLTAIKHCRQKHASNGTSIGLVKSLALFCNGAILKFPRHSHRAFQPALRLISQ